MAGWFTDVEYTMEDDRSFYQSNNVRRFKRTTGNNLLLCFGEKTKMVGYEGKLWAFHSFPADERFTDLRVPIVLLRVFDRGVGHDYVFDAWVYKKCKGRKHNTAYYGMLENVNHLLIRLQRWTRRMLQRERVRTILLRAVTSEKCAFGALGRDIIEGVILKMAFRGLSLSVK